MGHLRTLGRLTNPGKVHYCFQFCLFVDDGLDNGLMESQSLCFAFQDLEQDFVIFVCSETRNAV